MTGETIPKIAHAAASLWPNVRAVVEPSREVTFAALWQACLRAAAAFTHAGLAHGDRVAIWAPNSIDWIVACVGAQAAGGVVAPLNTRLKGAEAAYILNRARVRFLILTPPFLNVDYQVLLAGQDLPFLEKTILLGEEWDAFVAQGEPSADTETRALALSGDAPADIMFTSGTTGEPKGVVAGHEQTCRTFRSWVASVGLSAGDRYLIVNPFFHSFGYKAGWLACLMAGATAFPMQTLDARKLIDMVAAHKITVLPGPPAIFQTLLATDRSGADLSSIRLSVTGAANVPPALIESMRNELGIANVLTGYGLTEACGTVTMSRADDPAEVVARTCGLPIDGVEVRCVDAAGADVAQGEQGEVIVRGYNVMQGYFEDPQATAEVIDAEGWLHTGDVGRFDEAGRLMITDRLKDMYISGGFNCYPAEIEKALQQHPDVALAAVIGVPDDRLGEVGRAFIVPVAGRSPRPEDILAWARERLANYKTPRSVVIVDALPMNAAGKVRKVDLRSLA